MLRLGRQGNLIVARDGDGKVVHDKSGAVVRKVPANAPKATWRQFLREMTHNGEDLLINIWNIGQGVPFVSKHNGLESEPQVPTAEVRLRALEYLATMTFGKAPAANEVIQAEVQAEEVARFAAMSAEQLRELAAPLLNAPETDADITE